MAIVGIICEYNPFHNGHKHQFDLIRALLPGARIVCLMSGCFTQRGTPALHAPLDRARAALRAGADAVFELPCAYAVRDAEHFALGGVEILTRLAFVTHLCFGAEDDIAPLEAAAALLEAPSRAYTLALRSGLSDGLSLAAAQGRALSACLPGEAPAWERPNNILALCYLRALRRLHSPLIPLPVRREGNYHADTLDGQAWPSASAVRRAFLAGDFRAADAACPEPLPRRPVCLPDALDRVCLYKLRGMSADAFRALPDCTEGLENRVMACAAQAASREGLLALLKTRRYAHARLSRLCAHALLELDADTAACARPGYVRLLGFRRDAREMLSLLRESAIPVIAKAADGDRSDPLYALDLRAYDLWALGAGLPSGLMLRQGVAVV